MSMSVNGIGSVTQAYTGPTQTSAQKAEEEYETNAANSKQQFVDAGCEIIEVDADEWKATLDGFVENNYPDLVEYYQAIIDADK